MNIPKYTYSKLDYRFNPPANDACIRGGGKELDPETGNYYYGARYYDPKISVWLSVDPMASERSWLTPYNFVQNNPLMRVDPDGMLDGWVEGEDGVVSWDPKVGSQQDLVDQGKSGRYLGEAGYGALDGETGLRDFYSSDGHVYQTPEFLPEVVVDGGVMSDHARTMSNPIVQKIHKGQRDFIKSAAELGAYTLQKTGDGLAIAGYGLTLTGVGSGVGAVLAGAGSVMSAAGGGIQAGLQAADGNAQGATLTAVLSAASLVPGSKLMPAKNLQEKILSQNLSLKISTINHMINDGFSSCIY